MFKDVPATHWAKDYIETLGNMEILSGFPDGTFLPDEPVTRAQFATIVNKAFLSASSSEGSPEASQAFADVPADHWALDAINATRTSAFLFGYPGNLFRPEQNISRVQTLVSLVNGLNYTGGSIEALPYYKDAKDIPDYAKAGAATASAKGLVVNYPILNQLSPNRQATRAEVAAIAYWAMTQSNSEIVTLAQSPYRVPPQPSAWQDTPIGILPVVTKQIGISRDGERIVTLSAATDKRDRTEDEPVFSIQVWNVNTGELIAEKEPEAEAWFSAIAISEDGKQIAAISTTGSNADPANEISLWVWNIDKTTDTENTPVRQRLGTLRPQPNQPLQPPSQLVDAFTPTQVLFRPGDNAILTQISLTEQTPVERQLRLHSSATGEVLQTLTPTPDAILTQFAFSPDGRVLAARGSTSDSNSSLIDLWQRSRNERAFTLRAEEGTDLSLVGMGFAHTGTFKTLEQSNTQARLSTWNPQTAARLEQPRILNPIDRQDSHHRFSSDGISVLTSGPVAGPRILNTHTQTATPLAIGPTTLANSVFSPDGRYLAVATLNNVQIFSNETSAPRRQ
ncbi:MAG: S-layer homology domain-containing protein [Cyanobacteria bacterium J06614_10]